MPAIEVGSVAVSVVPSVKNFAKETRAKLGPQADELGIEIGRRIGAGISKGIGDPLDKPLRDLPKHLPQTGRDGEKLGGAFAEGFKRRAQAAFKSFPEPRIGADASAAEAKIADLRRELQTLSGKTVGLDIDAATATAELERIKAELDELAAKSPNVQVRVDAASASAELAAFDAEVNRLDGRNINVHAAADTSSAISSLTALAIEMAVVGSIPVAATVGAGIAGLVGPLGSATAGFGGLAAVAVPAVSRISKALQAQNTAQNQVSASGGRAAGAIRSVAVEQDQARIRALQMSAAQQQVASAVRQAAQAHSDALARVRDAERGLAAAQVSARQAQLDLNAARRQARLDAQDLANSVIDARLSVRGGQLAVEQAHLDLVAQGQRTAQAISAVGDAQKKLADAQAAAAKTSADPNATDAQKKAAAQAVADARKQVTAAQQAARQQRLAQRQAQLAYDQAVQSLREQRLQLSRLQKQKSESDKAGIDGDKNVIAARRQLAEANARVADQERAVAEARRNVARVDAQSSDAIASARRAVLQQQLSAKLASDQEAAAARNAAGAVGGASAASLRYAAALAKLTPAERDLMNHFLGLKDAYSKWAKALEPDVLPVLSKGLDLVKQQLPTLTPLVRGSARAFLDLENRAGAALRGPFWTQFFAMISREAPLAITRLGVSAGNTVKGIAGVVQAFLPYGNQLLAWIERGTARFATWGAQLNSSAGFARFMAYVREAGPSVVAAISGLWHAVEQLVVALAPAGPPLLEIIGGFGHLVGYLAQANPGLVQLIALVYGLAKANKVLGLTSLVAGFRGVGTSATVASAGMYRVGASARVATTSLVGTEAAAVSTKGAFAGLGIGATLLVVDFFALQAANRGMHKAFTDAVPGVNASTRALNQLNQTGRMTGKTWQGVNIAFAALARSPQVAARTSEIQKVFRSFDAALTSMVKSGNAKSAAADFNALWRVAQKNGVTWPAFTKQFPQYTNAVKGATAKTQSFTAALTSLYNRTQGDLLSANLQVAQSIKAVGDSLAANGKHIRGNSLAALQNRDAVRQAAQSIAGYVQNVYNDTKASKGETAARQKSIQVLKNRRKALIDEMVQSGISRKAAARLVDQYLKIPSKRATQFSTPGAKQSQRNVQDLGTAIAHIHGKRVVINAATKNARTQIGAFYQWFNKLNLLRYATIGFRQYGPGRQGLPLGTRVPKADGGIMRFANGSERHVAEVAPAGAMRIWAEKETKGEAYIPLARSKRPRSLAILRQVAKEFGYALAPLAGATMFARGGTTKPLSNVKAAAKAVPITSTTVGSDPASQMAGVANAATAANVATIDLNSTLPDYASAARGTVPASNLMAGRLAVLSARTKTVTDRTAVATTRLRGMGAQSAGASSTAASTLTRRMGMLTTAVGRNSAASSTNTTRLRTGTTATNTASRATSAHTARTNADTGAVRGQNSALATNAARLRKVAADAGTAARAVNKFVDAYKRKPYSISRSITVNAKGKFTMTGFTGGWATGGPVFGAGTATSDSIPARLSNGEHVWTAKEVAGAGGHGNVMALRQAAANGQVPGFASGGAVTKSRSIGKESVPKFTGDYEAMMKRIIDAAVKTTAKESAKLMQGIGGGTAADAKALAWARTQDGKHYQYGGNGNPSWDCSGFMSAIESVIRGQRPHRRWATTAFHGSTAPPGWQYHLRAPFMVGIHGGAGPNGHTAGTLLGVNVESSGSHGVQVGPPARGYRNGYFGNAWYGFRPSMGTGGGSTSGGLHASPAAARAYAFSHLGNFGWSPGYNRGPLNQLWSHESGWRWFADNPNSTAYGIPQALPGSKMRSAGPDWHDNAFTQINWGLNYIRSRYGSPAKAWRFWQGHNWYDQGGFLPPGPSLVYNGTGRPEPVLTDQQWRALEASTVGGDGGTVEFHAHFDGASRAELRHLTQSEFYRQSVRQSQASRPNRRR